MLIDEFLSEYDFVETHGISVQATAAETYRAANEVDFSESFIVRWLLRLRGMSGENVTLHSMTRSRFEILGETLDREMVIGLVGRFWTIGGALQKIDAESFKKFDTTGYAKAVWNFSLEPDGAETHLKTETRIKCMDAESKKNFGFYWTFIQPFSGLIRMEMLKLIKRKAESGI
ncbi:MAG TPA: hypothetical protein VMZ26_11645 [Pyrinomonadaceae bacterium]|nr:hypothetical protein [Pyrinomonadaceae bacterium]